MERRSKEKRNLDLAERLTFHLTPNEREELQEYADRVSTSLSRACRMLIKDGLRETR